MIHVSIGTINVLGLKRIKADVNPSTAYFMTPGRCLFDCAYCSRAKSSPDSDRLSRIVWPKWDEDEVFKSLGEAFREKKLKRACIQVVNNLNSFENTIRYMRKIREYSPIPISVSIRIRNLKSIERLFDAEADRICLPIDAADEKLHKEYRSGSLRNALNFIEFAAETYPGKISTHIIIGLGESERQVVELIKKFHNLNVTVGLFAFTPVKGTKLSDKEPPLLSKYRRIQSAHYLIINNIKKDFDYNSKDEIMVSDIPWRELRDSAFRTTGCPDCNRPYYNESPGGRIYNYPRPLSEKEFLSALSEVIG